MKNNIKYNIFLLISLLSRNLIEVFNIALLYKLNYSVKEIMLYYIIFFFTAFFVNVITLNIINYIKSKYVLLISNILFCYSYYYLNNMNYDIKHLIIFAILSSFSGYTYHIIRHYFALKFTDNSNKEIGSIAIFSFIGIIISSFIGPYITENYSFSVTVIIIFITSLISLIPLLMIKEEVKYEEVFKIDTSINLRKKLFFLFEQSKVLFLLIQPLYLYIKVDKNLSYIGIFNVVSSIASIIFIYFFVRKINIFKYFKYFNTLLVIILCLKLNIFNKYIMLIIAFFEGIFIKIYEITSMKNLYQIKTDNIKNYLFNAQMLFCLSRFIIISILYFVTSNVKVILYVMLIFILISGFFIKEVKNT